MRSLPCRYARIFCCQEQEKREVGQFLSVLRAGVFVVSCFRVWRASGRPPAGPFRFGPTIMHEDVG